MGVFYSFQKKKLQNRAEDPARKPRFLIRAALLLYWPSLNRLPSMKRNRANLMDPVDL